MNISELESRTGITKQNIRSYEQRELEAGIEVCKSLRHTELYALDADRVLRKMEELEERGGGDVEDEDVPMIRKMLLRFFNKYMMLLIMLLIMLLLNPEIFRHWWGWAIIVAFAPIVYRMWRIK